MNKTTACMLISMLIPCFTHPGAQANRLEISLLPAHCADVAHGLSGSESSNKKEPKRKMCKFRSPWVGNSLAPFLLERIFLNIPKMLQLFVLLPSVLTSWYQDLPICNISCLGFWGEIRYQFYTLGRSKYTDWHGLCTLKFNTRIEFCGFLFWGVWFKKTFFVLEAYVGVRSCWVPGNVPYSISNR